MRKNQKVSSFRAMAAATVPRLRRGARYYYVIDEDLWIEILKRLSVQSLCRFRCVCKGWNSIISSAFFINLHFTFNLSTTPCNLRPYLRVAHSDCVFYHPSHKRYTLCCPLDDEQPQQLHFPFRAEEDAGNFKRFTFVDVIHGVVCISYSCSSEVLSPAVNSTFLWNPSIHKYVALPPLRLPCDFFAIGFGYDYSTNDFKVVMRIKCNMWYKVYSARQGFWRRPKIKTSDEMKHLRGWIFKAQDLNSCFLNGIIHWLLCTINKVYSVLMFDCESEEFRRMDIPNIVSCSNYEIKLFEYAGKLSALVHMGSCMNLWVMEEHGVSASWKKLYIINPVCPDLELDDQGDQDLDLESDQEEDLELAMDPIPCHIIINDPSFEKLAPYGPNNQWIKSDYGMQTSQIPNDHIYNKSMFLMNHPKVQSYTSQDIVPILVSDP